MRRIKYKNYLAILSFSLIATFTFSSCSVVKQVQEAQNFAKCEFKLANVENTQLADVKIQDKKSVKDLNFMTASKLTSALTKDRVPLSFTLNLQVKNPNSKPASMNSLEWILFIDELRVVDGNVADKVTIDPNNGISTLPINIEFDLKEILSSKSIDTILNFAFNLSGEGSKPTRFLLKAKPTIDVAGFNVKYPGYIDVETEFTAAEGKKLMDQVVK